MTMPSAPAVDARGGLRPAHLVVGFLAFRWIVGVAESVTGQDSISEAAALLMLAALALLTASWPVFSRAAGVLAFGLIGLALIACLSLAANEVASRNAAIVLVLLLTLYALFVNCLFLWLGDEDCNLYLPAFARAFLLIGSALAIHQYMSGNGFVRPGAFQLPRAFGSDVHPVSFGIQLVAAMVMVFMAGSRRRGLNRCVDFAVLGLGLLALYMTLARTAWLMGAVVLILVIAAQRGFARKFLAIAAGLLAIVWLMQSGRFSDLQNLPQFLAHLDWSNIVFDYRYVDNSISWRIVNWGYGVRQALEMPLLGHGPGQSAIASAFQLEMHSIFLEVFFELGLAGLLALSVVIAGFIRLHRRVRGDRIARSSVHGFGLALLAGVTFSTSVVDQLMTILLYMCLLRLGAAMPDRSA